MRIIVILLVMLSFSSCEKLVLISQFIHGDMPECIVDEIHEFKEAMSELCNEGATIIKYEFQEEIVYAFSMGNCISDGSTDVLNENCELICLLGTIAGITECNDEPFENAKQLEVIWRQ